jgi:hypothetical protein
MARVGRLAGAIVAETGGAVYLVGNLKVPCDWATHGFEPPGEIDALARPYIRLSPCRAVAVAPPCLALELEGEALPRLLRDVFVIERTGSVSERMWRLVTAQTDDDARIPDVVPARWLAEVPRSLWQIVRDAVLRCT